MKLWIDDIRPAPRGYFWCKSVNEAKYWINRIEYEDKYIRDCHIDLIDMDHDAGDFVHLGGDYIRLLDWLEETNRDYSIRIHSQNPVGVKNMRRIIERNGWKEVF